MFASLFGKKRKVVRRKPKSSKKVPRARPDGNIRRQAKKYKVKIASKTRGYRKLSIIKREIRQKRKAIKVKKAAAAKRKASKRKTKRRVRR